MKKGEAFIVDTSNASEWLNSLEVSIL
jgi:hypothetical protein